jgi:glycosyltransferase involved in cell wall biosynthesis
VEARDPNALARAIERLLDDPAQAEAQRQRGLERSRAFDWSDTAARTLAFYHRVLGR